MSERDVFPLTRRSILKGLEWAERMGYMDDPERDLAREVAERAIRKNHERLVGPISDAEWASDKCNSPFRLDIAVAAIGAREALLEAAKVAAEWGEGPSTMHLTIGEFANRYGEHDCLYDVLRALAGERDDG